MSTNALLISEFRAAFPAFSNTTTYTDLYVSRKLDEAWRQMNPSRLGERTSDAQGYLAAHLLTLFPPSTVPMTAGAREVQSVTAGRASVTYSSSQNASTIEGSLGSTVYGKEYLRLIRLTGGATLIGGAGLI